MEVENCCFAALKDYPKISIVTPSFNQGQYIEETICSVLDQGYPNLEYIIIDGGSKDGTVDIIKKYKKYLKYWVSERDKGQSHAINKGLEYCTGEIFNWLNSDDLLMEQSLNLIAERFADPHVDIVSGREIHFDNKSQTEKYGTIIYENLERNLYDGTIYQPSTFWRKSALMPLLPVNETLHYLMDTHLWISYILSNGTHRIVKTDEVYAKFRLHNDSKTVGFHQEFQNERWQIRSKLLESLTDYHDLIEFLQVNCKCLHDFELPESQIEVNQKRLAGILLDDCIYEAYFNYDYSRVKKLIKFSFSCSIITVQLLHYLVRLYLVPSFVLRYFRNAK